MCCSSSGGPIRLLSLRTVEGVREEPDWVVERDAATGLDCEAARGVNTPERYRGGMRVRGGEGWTMRQLDLSDPEEFVLVTDSGTMLEFLSDEDAKGLFTVAIRRFRSAADRAAWLDAQELGPYRPDGFGGLRDSRD